MRLSHKYIAEHTGMSRSYVYREIKKIRKKIPEYIETMERKHTIFNISYFEEWIMTEEKETKSMDVKRPKTKKDEYIKIIGLKSRAHIEKDLEKWRQLDSQAKQLKKEIENGMG